MSKKKNGGYDRRSIIVALVIFAFLASVLPMAVALIAMGVILFVIYKNISKQKNLEESKKIGVTPILDGRIKESIRSEDIPESRGGKPKDKICISHMDTYFGEAGRLVTEKGKASPGMIQREFKIGFNRAERIVNELCEAGIVGEEIGTAPREVLMSRDVFDELLIEERIEVMENDIANPSNNRQQEPTSALNRIDMYSNQYDYMTGEDFEAYVAMILQQIGFINVQLTKGSGDQGVDILAEKDGMKYAFQCKRYDKPVGNKAVQEVFAGKFFYHCHVAVVVTNNCFTQSAKELANENGVVLWDRDKLNSLIYSIQPSSERSEENLEEKEDEDRICILYKKPPLALLRKGGRKRITDEELRDTAINIQRIARNLGVDLCVANVNVGARFIRYGILAEGISVNRIKDILEDIKYRISSKNIFIDIPISLEDTIGICIEDSDSHTVRLRDMMESKEFGLCDIPIPIGRDIMGNYIIEDVAKNHSLFVGGVFNSGKTSCLNSIIMSIIYNSTPNEVKLIMVDTKGMDFPKYNGIPHLLIPIVTDVRKALGALTWCVKEIDERYTAFASVNAKNIYEYNNVGGIDKKIPQILTVIDDLSELMSQYKNETEQLLVRMLKFSKDAGMHIIVSCRSQSEEVVTGLIKANMPNRILFKVFSATDSVAIINQSGGEELLGNGDMLFKKEECKKIMRVQGAYVSDEEICNVVEFLRAKS